MKRRVFFKAAAAVAALLGLPVKETVAANSDTGNTTTRSRSPEALLEDEVTRLRIGTHATAELRETNRHAREAGGSQPFSDPPDDENNYWAKAIRRGNRYFYRVGSTTVECTKREYTAVIASPNTYYFSSALVLHVRIQRKRDGLPALS